MATSPTVLLVDDNPAILDTYNAAIPVMSDYHVVTAADGMQALEQLEQLLAAGITPACMVIDIKMPQLNGYQLVKVIRGDPQTADLPLVILTALAQERDQFVGLASGADQYLTKPVDVSELLEAIQQAITLGTETRLERLRQLADEEGL